MQSRNILRAANLTGSKRNTMTRDSSLQRTTKLGLQERRRRVNNNVRSLQRHEVRLSTHNRNTKMLILRMTRTILMITITNTRRHRLRTSKRSTIRHMRSRIRTLLTHRTHSRRRRQAIITGLRTRLFLRLNLTRNLTHAIIGHMIYNGTLINHQIGTHRIGTIRSTLRHVKTLTRRTIRTLTGLKHLSLINVNKTRHNGNINVTRHTRRMISTTNITARLQNNHQGIHRARSILRCDITGLTLRHRIISQRRHFGTIMRQRTLMRLARRRKHRDHLPIITIRSITLGTNQ